MGQIKIGIDRDAQTLPEALNVDVVSIASKQADLTRDLITHSDFKWSDVADRIQNEFTDEEILLLATSSVKLQLEQFLGRQNPLAQLLKELGN